MKKRSSRATPQTQFNSLTQIEGIFSDPTQGVGGALSAFFNSLSQLSTNPTDTNARQPVLTSANNLANSFHQAVSSLNTIGTGLDQSVPQTVDQINRLTSQIATLNGQVAQMQGLGQDPGTVQDQRDELIRQLSGLVNVSVTQTEHGLTLTTGERRSAGGGQSELCSASERQQQRAGARVQRPGHRTSPARFRADNSAARCRFAIR